MRLEDNLREDHGRTMKLFAVWQKMLGELDHSVQALNEALAKHIILSKYLSTDAIMAKKTKFCFRLWPHPKTL